MYGSVHIHGEPQRRQGDAEIERLKALLIKVIQRLAKHEPDALQLLDQIAPPELNDSLDEAEGSRWLSDTSQVKAGACLWRATRRRNCCRAQLGNGAS